jgi:hypothetical protein
MNLGQKKGVAKSIRQMDQRGLNDAILFTRAFALALYLSSVVAGKGLNHRGPEYLLGLGAASILAANIVHKLS